MEVLTREPHHSKATRLILSRVCRCLAAVVWMVLASLPTGLRAQEIAREYQLKAVLLYNLTQFIDWPATAFDKPDSPFVICILGFDPFGKVLDEAVREESSNHRPIVVRRISRIEEAHDAQVVFLNLSRRRDLLDALDRLRGRPILTVGDSDTFHRVGGMVRMAPTPDHKIRIRIDLENARASGLSISAKLLRVCTIVQPGDE